MTQRLILTLVLRTLHSLFSYSAQEIRSNPELLSLFVLAYKEVYGSEPSCSGCALKSEFENLKRHYENREKKEVMSTNKTFQLVKVKNEILSYVHKGQKYRMYDFNMTEEFAIAFLTNGTKEQIEERKGLFKKIPDSLIGKKLFKKRKKNNE